MGQKDHKGPKTAMPIWKGTGGTVSLDKIQSYGKSDRFN